MRRLRASPLNLLIYPGKHKPRSQQKLIGSRAPSWHINYLRVYCFMCCFVVHIDFRATILFYRIRFPPRRFCLFCSSVTQIIQDLPLYVSYGWSSEHVLSRLLYFLFLWRDQIWRVAETTDHNRWTQQLFAILSVNQALFCSQGKRGRDKCELYSVAIRRVFVSIVSLLWLHPLGPLFTHAWRFYFSCYKKSLLSPGTS